MSFFGLFATISAYLWWTEVTKEPNPYQQIGNVFQPFLEELLILRHAKEGSPDIGKHEGQMAILDVDKRNLHELHTNPISDWHSLRGLLATDPNAVKTVVVVQTLPPAQIGAYSGGISIINSYDYGDRDPLFNIFVDNRSRIDLYANHVEVTIVDKQRQQIIGRAIFPTLTKSELPARIPYFRRLAYDRYSPEVYCPGGRIYWSVDIRKSHVVVYQENQEVRINREIWKWLVSRYKYTNVR